MAESEMMTMGRAAEEIGVHKMTLYRWEKEGKLEALGVVPRRLRHGTRERQFTKAQVERIKRWHTEVDEPAAAGSAS